MKIFPVNAGFHGVLMNFDRKKRSIIEDSISCKNRADEWSLRLVAVGEFDFYTR